MKLWIFFLPDGFINVGGLEVLDIQPKRGRDYADDSAGRSAHIEGFAEYVRIRSELSLPQTLRYDDRGVRAAAILVFGEVAPKDWLNS